MALRKYYPAAVVSADPGVIIKNCPLFRILRTEGFFMIFGNKRTVYGMISAAAVGVTMIFGGCAYKSGTDGNTAPGLDGLYSADCEIVCSASDEEMIYSGKMTRLGGGSWELVFDTPETVKGLKLTLDSEGMTASMGDLNFRLETDRIPNKAAFITVFGILDDAAAADDLRFAETETALCYYGKYGDENYTLSYNKAENTLCAIETGNITVSVEGFAVNGDTQ